LQWGYLSKQQPPHGDWQGAIAAVTELRDWVMRRSVSRLEVAVQQLRRWVKPVGPDDRWQLVIDPDLAEVVWVLERLSEGPVQ
jgi:hypothetical protein